eukprot:14252415-Heterocapsa_arctica.AAC.1
MSGRPPPYCSEGPRRPELSPRASPPFLPSRFFSHRLASPGTSPAQASGVRIFCNIPHGPRNG